VQSCIELQEQLQCFQSESEDEDYTECVPDEEIVQELYDETVDNIQSLRSKYESKLNTLTELEALMDIDKNGKNTLQRIEQIKAALESI
jgi:hypothetical protein